MSLEENKEIIRRLNNVFNTQNWDLIDDIMSSDYVDHTNKIQGPEALKTLMKMGKSAFPDWHENIEDIIVEGDKVWVFLTYTATHTGEWFGVAPTGNKMTTTSVDIYRIVNGKIAEYWNVTNNLNLFQALGLIENTEVGDKFFQSFILEDVK